MPANIVCFRGTDIPKLYFHVHFSKPNVQDTRKKKKPQDNSSDYYQLVIHRIVQQVHKLAYFPEVRHRKCERAVKFRVSCIRILRHLIVIFEVTKAKNIGKANDLNLNENYLVFLSTSHKVYDRVLH